MEARRAHNPEVAGSNPAPATKKYEATLSLGSFFCLFSNHINQSPQLHYPDSTPLTITDAIIRMTPKEQRHSMKTIILASASPRRKQLLENFAFKFEVVPSDYEEDLNSVIEPHELAKAISLGKAEAVAAKRKNVIVIAADTFIVLGSQILGKPHTQKRAREMLETISGKTHSVITGFSIIDKGNNKTLSKSVETKVHIKKLTLSEIDAYVQSKEPLDKAGAYAIQSLGSVFVKKIEGDYFNVIGLPMSALSQALKKFGINIL